MKPVRLWAAGLAWSQAPALILPSAQRRWYRGALVLPSTSLLDIARDVVLIQATAPDYRLMQDTDS